MTQAELPRSKQKQVLIRVGLLVLLAALIVVCARGRAMLDRLPFTNSYQFAGPSAVYAGDSGRVYVIDEANKAILILDQQGRLASRIQGGQAEDGFYYASYVTEDSQGRIYVADVLWSGQGTTVAAERIFRYDQAGKNPELIYTQSYDDPNTAPKEYGNIKSLDVEGDSLIFTSIEDSAVTVNVYNIATAQLTSRYYDTGFAAIFSADVDPDIGLPVWVTRLGQVCTLDENGAIRVLAQGGTMPDVSVEDGWVYYADMNASQVLRVDMAGNVETLLECEDILSTAFVHNGSVYATDSVGYYVLCDGNMDYIQAVPMADLGLRIAVWAALVLAVALGVYFLTLLVRYVHNMKKTETFTRIVIVLCVSLCVSAIVSYLILSELITDQNESNMNQLGLFCDIMVDAADADALEQIDSLSDYRSEAYWQVRTVLDQLTDSAYHNGMYYYYQIYATDGETIYTLLDYEDTLSTRQPIYTWGEPGYTQCLQDGVDYVEDSDISSLGSWCFVTKPVYSSDGRIIAAMEVGMSLDDSRSERSTLIWNVILTVFTTITVLIMVVIEVLMFLSQRMQRQTLAALENPFSVVPLRAIYFIVILVDCLSDGFVSVLSTSLYTPILGIPPGVGAALPISGEVLMTAVFSLLGGALIRKTGTKLNMLAGLAVEISGFLVCALIPTWSGLLLGKLLTGAGVGLLYISVNVLAATGTQEEARAEAFAAVSAAALAGTSAGAGLGSILLSVGSYQIVFFCGAAILLLALGMIISSPTYRPGRSEQEASDSRLTDQEMLWLTDLPAIRQLFGITDEGMPDKVRTLLRIIDKSEFAPGQNLVVYGAEPDDGMYVILSGTCGIYDGSGNYLNDCGKGNIIGEMALINSDTRSATVTAKEPTACARISKDLFDRLVKEDESRSYGALMRSLYSRVSTPPASQAAAKLDSKVSSADARLRISAMLNAGQDKPRISLGKFMLDRKVIAFLLLSMMPYMMALAYSEYFFPIFANEHGLSETDISRVYLLCGLVVIYAGPPLMEFLLEKIGAKWSLAISSGMVVAAALLFVIAPTLVSVILGVLLLSISTGFGYAAQSTYFSSLPAVSEYGEDRALGIYSLFENGGSTLGPMVMGLLMLCGYQLGIGILAVVMTGLILLFALTSLGGRKKDKTAANR